ncbi:hypothetical protein ACVBAX_13370 [Robertmurraya sp. GLU-23]
MDFKRIPVVLKRYSFDAKMHKCQSHSKKLMTLNGLVNADKLRSMALPWDLETFALFSTITLGEYSNADFEDRRGDRQFVEIISALKEYMPPKLEEAMDSNSNSFLDYFMIVTGLNQFQIQENIPYKVFRYSYIFNFINDNVDMNKHFIEKFGCGFEDFIKFGFIIQFLFSNESINHVSLYNYVIERYRHIVETLTIEREKFNDLQQRITDDITHYIYGFKYFYQFPFISYNQKFYLPLPHLIMHAVTSSLLFRLTEGNNHLRQLFGKEVLESYLLHICRFSEHFDEVVPEFSYHHNMNRTLDIMVRKDSQCIMLDSKSMSPRVSIRNLSDKDILHTIDRMAEAVKQVYLHITQRFRVDYYPFEETVDFQKEDIFGVVILFEDSYVRRDIIMSNAADKLGLMKDSEEYKYLLSNVKVMGLYELEKMLFVKEDIFRLLSANRDNPSKWFDLSYMDFEGGKKEVIKEISDINDNMKDIIIDFAKELEQAGLISS